MIIINDKMQSNKLLRVGNKKKKFAVSLNEKPH